MPVGYYIGFTNEIIMLEHVAEDKGSLLHFLRPSQGVSIKMWRNG